jgi:hypothetical protein
MNLAYRQERARMRDYLTGILDAIDGLHRAMAHGELEDAARYADDLRVLGSSVQRTMQRLQNLVADASARAAAEQS